MGKPPQRMDPEYWRFEPKLFSGPTSFLWTFLFPTIVNRGQKIFQAGSLSDQGALTPFIHTLK